MQSKLVLVIFILFAFGKSASAETEHAMGSTIMTPPPRLLPPWPLSATRYLSKTLEVLR